MTCTRATFPDGRKAYAMRREIKRVYNANSSIYMCEDCDHYHISMEVGRYPVSESWARLLQYIAQGMTNDEIIERTGYTKRTIEWTIGEMCKRFYALNRIHLIAISIALGIVNPNEFVPTLTKESHEPSPA